MYPLDSSHIDKSLPIPVNRQLRGLLELLLSNGGLPPGSRLPSVRELAEQLGIAVMTVNQVYRQLADSGLIEIRRGLGAFTPRPEPEQPARPDLADLRARIDALLQCAEREKLDFPTLIDMISAQAQLASRSPLRIALAGPFRQALESYAADLRVLLYSTDRIDLYEIDRLRADEGARRDCAAADAVLALAHREKELRTILSGHPANILPLRLELSAATQARLAALPAGTRIVAVAAVADYVATLRPTILAAAPQVVVAETLLADAPDLAAKLRAADAIVHSSGAQRVAALAPGTPAFELGYAPDLRDAEARLLPRLGVLRRAGLTQPA